MDYNLTLSEDKYTLAILKTINCFLNLTDFELLIINKMIDNDIDELNTNSRKRLKSLLGDKSDATVNNYIKRLKDKKVLIENETGMVINNNILSAIKDGELNFKFNVN
jgi:hypothetical protein